MPEDLLVDRERLREQVRDKYREAAVDPNRIGPATDTFGGATGEVFLARNPG
jgi:hypothetical protein